MKPLTLNRLIKKMGKDNILVCETCGSPYIQEQAWVNPNTKEYCMGDTNKLDDRDSHWCDDCEDHVGFCYLSNFEKMMDDEIKSLPSDKPMNALLQKIWNRLPYMKKRAIWLAMGSKNEAAEKPSFERSSAILDKVRNDMLENIRGIMTRYGLAVVNTDSDIYSTPIIQVDYEDGNNTYTLDAIKLQDDKLLFTASNCWNTIEVVQDEISTEVAAQISDWLTDIESELAESFFAKIVMDIEISDAEANLKIAATELKFCDEGIDDGLDSEENDYLMRRSYDVTLKDKTYHLLLYFGDRDRVVSTLTIN